MSSSNQDTNITLHFTVAVLACCLFVSIRDGESHHTLQFELIITTTHNNHKLLPPNRSPFKHTTLFATLHTLVVELKHWLAIPRLPFAPPNPLFPKCPNVPTPMVRCVEKTTTTKNGMARARRPARLTN